MTIQDADWAKRAVHTGTSALSASQVVYERPTYSHTACLGIRHRKTQVKLYMNAPHILTALPTKISYAVSGLTFSVKRSRSANVSSSVSPWILSIR